MYCHKVFAQWHMVGWKKRGSGRFGNFLQVYAILAIVRLRSTWWRTSALSAVSTNIYKYNNWPFYTFSCRGTSAPTIYFNRLYDLVEKVEVVWVNKGVLKHKHEMLFSYKSWHIENNDEMKDWVFWSGTYLPIWKIFHITTKNIHMTEKYWFYQNKISNPNSRAWW